MKHRTSRAADPRWASVLARDPSSDFFYSVETTGVYCRPSCGSRRPLLQNVRFHASSQDAERAGFRPCRRCKPHERSLDARATQTIAQSCRLIESSRRIPTLPQLAKAAGLSPSHFHRLFKSVTGLTPKDYAAAHRAKHVRTELEKSHSVTDAIYNAGFQSTGRFYAQAADMLGMAPTTYRTGGANEEIEFAVGECSLGSILVGATERGICAILIGEDPDALVRDLQDRFPRATFKGGDRRFEEHVARVVGFVEAPQLGVGLPLDVRGTAFQRRVWRALCDIPPGTTASYAEIARKIGVPTSVRAVASACAANAIAVAIPCHRVVRTDGALSGYRWGIDRKRKLIEREKR